MGESVKRGITQSAQGKVVSRAPSIGPNRVGMMNDKHKLGLPFEYQQKPEYFDAHNVNDSTESKNAFIEQLLKVQNVKTVLDMTCGTGSQVFYLARRGYEVTGSDFSPTLLEQARRKAAAADLDFEKALRNIQANLEEGGVYVFDIFNLQAMRDDVIAGFSMDLESVVDDAKIRNVQHSEIDRENGFLISHVTIRFLKVGASQKYTPTVFLYKFIPLESCKKYLSETVLKLFVAMTWKETILWQTKA